MIVTPMSGASTDY